MNHCKISLIYSERCNFYDDIVDFTTCNEKSKYISKNVLIVKKTNTIFIKIRKNSILNIVERIIKRNNNEFYHKIIIFDEFNNNKKLQRYINHN